MPPCLFLDHLYLIVQTMDHLASFSLTYSVFLNGRQKVFAYSSGLKDFYDLKHVAFFHLVWVILIFGFQSNQQKIILQNWGMWKKCRILRNKWKYKGKSHKFTGMILSLITPQLLESLLMEEEKLKNAPLPTQLSQASWFGIVWHLFFVFGTEMWA